MCLGCYTSTTNVYHLKSQLNADHITPVLIANTVDWIALQVLSSIKVVMKKEQQVGFKCPLISFLSLKVCHKPKENVFKISIDRFINFTDYSFMASSYIALPLHHSENDSTQAWHLIF